MPIRPERPAERLADRTNLGPDHRHPDDVPLPGTEDLTPLDESEWWDDCECGWSSGHRSLCCCGSWAAHDAGETYECDCGTCTAINLDRIVRGVGPGVRTVTPSGRYL